MAGLPMIGALMGMCLGGPIGFLAGVKIGGLAAVGGSILGYTGASVVRYVFSKDFNHRLITIQIEHYISFFQHLRQRPKGVKRRQR